ncbi:MAG: valine--tRNA ligase [Hyphomonas sp.]|uniref:valine--tRNA ligase n=1 Tax=Hyphomonas sp. TaxID=87 RepID=UPI00184DFCDA|nr:valine--tRNA ligase [Hyphomonas sp.]MBA3070161.1 valine--tRNA ligase [Hyphomonas sp.]MBU3920004.1 valine--tRNA ligase [Alphaproteobacteria bacterium]MBU4060263.1 valine--tRNA ligase [Alphaproteobacteria bacterium]MBU4162931.1 valine--tRNA ligase [Alphaproteobacteria bacterium]
MLDQRFDPADAEPRLYKAWEEAGCFHPSGDTSAQAYSIVIPPPNVTGVLHMGHALNNTLQDLLVRFERMRGKNVLWQPGTDHAGIATQMVVERQLAKEGNLDRRSMGREAFLKRVWAWKEESGGAITGQLKRLGASCDWSRERFTMDEGLSKAVTKVFVDLHAKGLIYRDKRLVNWDPHFQTAISDLEVETKEVAGHYWHLRYPLADGVTYDHPVKDEDGNVTHETRDYIVVATSRPETMLGDTGVAVHPEDERYASLVGKFVELPIVGRRIPIVADEYANPEKGSGAVKITPAHDFNDFEVGKRAGHTPLNILTAVAAIVNGAEADAAGIPAELRGLDRFAARAKVVEAFEAAGLLERIEDLKIEQPFGDRSGVVIEPWMTDQWYVDAATLAKPARAAVEDGRTRFVPENWSKTYYNWMDNIQPWCVSRQLWWGHRIPAWYDEAGNVYVASTEKEARAKAGKGVNLRQDEDVLDTWFSSALWPFSTQGWPENTEALKTFYPTSTLVTAFDIIFFWVARMMMMGLEFTGEAPFKDVYIHALVLDEKGQKMSKSKGNAMDPLELVDEFGADALRFTMAAMAAQGRNIRLSKQRVEGYRNFSTKLWNAARFAEMNECGAPGEFDPCSAERPINQWILSELADCVSDVTKGIEEYRFNEAAGALYKFIWNTLCDWYLELIKPLLMGMDDAAKSETRAVCGHVIDEALKLLHPFMPFVTEELWERRAPGRSEEQGFLMLQSWPEITGFGNAAATEEIEWLIEMISEIRSLRNDLGVPAGAKVPMTLVNPSEVDAQRLERHDEVLRRMARLDDTGAAATLPPGAVSTLVGSSVVALRIADLIDIGEAQKRLDKEVAQLEKDIVSTEKKLANADFVARAPEEIVEENRDRVKDWSARRDKLKAARTSLAGIS